MDKDIYSLINSKAIEEYNRKNEIKYNDLEKAKIIRWSKKLDFIEKREYLENFLNENKNINYYFKEKIEEEIKKMDLSFKNFFEEKNGFIYIFYIYDSIQKEYYLSRYLFYTKLKIDNNGNIKKDTFNFIEDIDIENLKIDKVPLNSNFFETLDNDIEAIYELNGNTFKLKEIEDNRLPNIWVGLKYSANLKTPFKKGDILIGEEGKKFKFDKIVYRDTNTEAWGYYFKDNGKLDTTYALIPGFDSFEYEDI